MLYCIYLTLWEKVIKCESRNEFNKFNNTGARLLDSIFPMTLKYFFESRFGVKMLKS